MSVNRYNIKKWFLMLTGRSLAHVEQGIGKVYSKNSIKGYYNDLTKKVTRSNFELIPIETVANGQQLYVATEIFQYGLGAYDLFLITKQHQYLNKFKACLEWAVLNQQEDGSWNNFYYVYPGNPYSAMTQGEGISLLLRGYVFFHNNNYMLCAQKAVSFLIKDVNEGGTSRYEGDGLVLLEYTHLPLVLNGWIFALFGLLDFQKVTHDETITVLLYDTMSTMKKKLPEFDNGYWSMYDNVSIIASPFYHKLHIALLNVMGDLFDDPCFFEYAKKFNDYTKKPSYRIKSFVKKVLQKIKE
jgi:hypothetical protein